MPKLQWIVAGALLALTTACGAPDADGGAEGGSASSPPDGMGEELLVSAAASLSDAFAALEAAFESAHPGVDVILNTGGSSALRAQILEGAPVDVFASADESDMDHLIEAGEVADAPMVFARNLLRIAVPRGNPAGVSGLDDFANEELLIGLCAEGVPCGDLAREALARAGVTPVIDTNEPDVRALLTRIELGELDAGITYVTDVASAADAVEGVRMPAEHEVVAGYPVAVTSRAPNPRAASAFVELLLSEDGRAILERHGFLTVGGPRR